MATNTLKLDPYPAILVLSFDQKPFKTEEYKDSIGLTANSGSQFKIYFHLDSNVQTKIGAVVHETAHVVQLLEDYVQTKFDKETFAYMS